MNKQSWLVVCALLLLVIMPLGAEALGTTSAYHSANPLILKQGETKRIVIGITNTAGDPQNVTLIANITQGAEIAQLVEPNKQYFVPFGTSNTIGIDLTVTAPDAPVGTTYTIEVIATTVTPGVGGGVVLGQSMGTSIPVIISSPTGEITPKKGITTELIVLIVLIVIVVAAIIIVILSMKKKKQKK